MYHLQSTRVLVPPTAEPLHLDEVKAFLRVTDSNEDALIGTLIEAAHQEACAFLRRSLLMQTLETVMDCFPSRGPIYLGRPPLLKFDSFKYLDAAGAEQTQSAALYQVDYRSTPARVLPAYAETWPIIRGGEDINSIVLTYRAGYEVPVSANMTTDKLSAAHPFANDQRVRLRNSGGALPGGLAERTDYFILNASANDFELAASAGGAKIDLTTAGTGQSFVAPADRGVIPGTILQAMLQSIAHWFEHRESVIVGTIASNLPHAAKSLMWKHRIMGF